MNWTGSLRCGVVWVALLCFAPVCPSAQEHPNGWHDRHTQVHQRTHSTNWYCDRFLNNQIPDGADQKCGSGFYREWTGPHQGLCVQCSCNGLSNECEEHTGNCLNCQFNTEGDHCERCKEGYYVNAASRTCRICPCPFTWNNFALACMDIGAGEIECLCKHGYTGTRCERCAHGYYGNPVVPGGSCKPRSWGDGSCDSLNGGCDSCIYALLLSLEGMDGSLAWLKQQLQNISLNGPGSSSILNNLEATISETKIQVERRKTAVGHLVPKVEQLDTDVNVVSDDMSRLIDKTLQTESDLEKVLQDAFGTELNADFHTEAVSFLITIQDLIKQLSRKTKRKTSVMLSKSTQRIVQEMRQRSCDAQRNSAGSEQEEAHKLLNLVRGSMTVPAETIQGQTADSLMVSNSSLRELAELLSATEDRVIRTQGLNLKNHTMLQLQQHLQAQTEKKQSTILPVTEMTKDLLNNMTDILLMLEEIKKDTENHAAQLDGARRRLLEKLKNIKAKADIVNTAEEHTEQLNRAAGEFQGLLHNATNSSELLIGLDEGAYNSIINAIEEVEMAANQSREAADEALKEGGLVNRADGLRDDSTHFRAEANNTHNDHETLSHTSNTQRGHVKKQKEKKKSVRMGISAVSDDLETIRRDDIKDLIESAKAAASASNSTVGYIADRLMNISQEVEGIMLSNDTANMAEQAAMNLTEAVPVLMDNLTQVEALSKNAPPSANMTEIIRAIKDMIEETRTLVNRVPFATSFNGKGHVELHPPRNLEDLKAFTAFDLLLNHRQNNLSKARRKRRRRQDKHGDESSFIFYLGSKDASGDYIGMAIAKNALTCVYKLGEFVHEVKTSQITTIKVNSPDFVRVVFHRVYQDAKVNITQNSQNPTSVSSKLELSNLTAGVLNLDPDNVVVYVGGYPDDFMPPAVLHYPKYKGTMKLSYINDNPVSLFNYKHAVNINADNKVPHSEVSDYYDGTGYSMAFIKDERKKRLFRFYTKSRATEALLLYIGNEESFFCLFVERGFLVLQGQQAGRELRVQSAEKMSLFGQFFVISTGEKFIVRYGRENISTDYIHTTYTSYYIGGLPAQLRQRHKITALPLRGCVEYLKVDGEIAEYNRTIGVSDGCPDSLLGVCAATLYSALSIESLFVWDEQPLRVSLGFKTTEKYGTLLRNGSQGSISGHDIQLSLADGYVVFHSHNHTLVSDKRYSDGKWHYLSAVGKPTGLELSIDNVLVSQGQLHPTRPVDQNSQGEKFKGCIANLYMRRPEQSFIPADLSSFPQTDDIVLGQCSLHSSPHTKLLPAPLKTYKPIHAPKGSQCQHHGEYQLYDEHSWLSYTLPQEDLNFRPHFSFDVKTKSSKGLIFHVAGRGVVPLLALYMANGKIKMSLGQDRVIHHKQKSNDGNWHRVEFSVEMSTFHLLVDGVRVTDGDLPNSEGLSLDLHNPVYLGGNSESRTTNGHHIPTNSITGCIRDLKMNDEAVEEPAANHKTVPCFDEITETGTYFGGGHVVLDNYFTVSPRFALSFELRPQYLTGLLLHVQSDKASLNVFLEENKVGVKVNVGNRAVSVNVKTHKSLCDGKFHRVIVSKQAEVIKLVVDSVSEEKDVPFAFSSHSAALDSLSIGGITTHSRVPVSSPFVGCLRNVEVNGRPVSFETESRVIGPVSIKGCPKN